MHRRFDIADAASPARQGVVHAAVPHSLRSRGVLDLSFRRRGDATVIDRSFQSGCTRMRLPRGEAPGEAPCAVLINTAGGVAEGDRIEQAIGWGADTRATVTSQAAEKVYRALALGSTIDMRIDVAAGAEAEWLPQETILFDGARLRRDTRVLLAENVSFLGVEAVVLGRAAMGETMRRGSLSDRLRIWRGGRLIYADALSLDADVSALMAHAATGGGASAMAVLVHASDRASSLIEPVRAALDHAKGRAAASTWNGLLAVRLLAPDGETLRHDIAAALAVLRDGRPLPRVWRC
ncbi:MAG: urease accessory protein UreD [Sphingobium sp.]